MISRFVNWYNEFRKKYVIRERRPYDYAINRYYAHKIDPFFTKIAYDLKLSPNMVTILAAFTGVSAALAILTDHLITGAILLQLWHFLDGTDGNLARLTNQCTSFGAKLDVISDQIVRFSVLLSIAIAVDVPLGVKILFIATLYIDLSVVHLYVLPFMKKYPLIRAKWKKWFLDRGIIPGLDMFTVFFVFSICAILNQLEFGVYFFIIFKNLDWMYRVWECLKSKHYYEVTN